MFIQNWLCRSCHVTNGYGRKSISHVRAQEFKTSQTAVHPKQSLLHSIVLSRLHEEMYTGKRVKMLLSLHYEIWNECCSSQLSSNFSCMLRSLRLWKRMKNINMSNLRNTLYEWTFWFGCQFQKFSLFQLYIVNTAKCLYKDKLWNQPFFYDRNFSNDLFLSFFFKCI